MISFLVMVLYLMGATVTMIPVFGRLDAEREPLSNWQALWYCLTAALAIEFWPLYWAGKLLEAPAQLLLPPPGELTVTGAEPKHFDCTTKSCYEHGCTDDCPIGGRRE